MKYNKLLTKTAFLAFGDEFMGVIIQSPYIAESMRQLLRMIGEPEEVVGEKKLAKAK